MNTDLMITLVMVGPEMKSLPDMYRYDHPVDPSLPVCPVGSGDSYPLPTAKCKTGKLLRW